VFSEPREGGFGTGTRTGRRCAAEPGRSDSS
jgi:hypothetical protein